METQPPSPKRGQSPLPNFRPISIVAKWLDAPRCHLVWSYRPQPRGLCVRWKHSPFPRKGGGAPSPFFGPSLLWPNGWMDQDGSWHGGGPWSKPHCTRWGRSSRPPKMGQTPLIFGPCRQTAGCIKMPLGMEVGLSPGDFVLDGDAAFPPLKGHSPPIFVQCPLWPNDWMDEDATWYRNRPRPRPYCITRGPSSARKGHSSLPSFRPMSIVAMVAHLSY